MAVVTEQIVAFFTNVGVPATGLSPTIRIRELAGDTLVITDAAMVEVGEGMYRYNFTAYDTTVNYAIRCDGTATLPNAERYVFAANEDYEADTADAVWDAALSSHVTASSMGANQNLIDDIETKVQADARQTLLIAEHDSTQAQITALNDPTVGAIADAVWDEAAADHVVSGSLGEMLKVIEQILRNRRDTNPSTAILTIYDDTDVPLLTANIFEDVNGTTPYNGGLINRVDRLT